MAGERYMTRDHATIREWVETRGGTPATVASTHETDDAGLIRLDFRGYSGGDSLEEIPWEEWFRKFDESSLVLLYQETTASGEQSSFHRLITRETAERRDDATWVGEPAGRRESDEGSRRRERRSATRAGTS